MEKISGKGSSKKKGASQNSVNQHDDLEWDPYCLGSIEDHERSLDSLIYSSQPAALTLKRTLQFLKVVDENAVRSEQLREKYERKERYDEIFHAEVVKLEEFMESSRINDDDGNEIELAGDTFKEVKAKIIKISTNWNLLKTKFNLEAKKRAFIQKDISSKIIVWKISKFIEHVDTYASRHFFPQSEMDFKSEHLESISQKNLESVQEMAEDFFSFQSVVHYAESSHVLGRHQTHQIHTSAAEKVHQVLDNMKLFQTQLEVQFLRKVSQSEQQFDPSRKRSQDSECENELKKDFEDKNDVTNKREITDAQIEEHFTLTTSLRRNICRVQKRRDDRVKGQAETRILGAVELNKTGNGRKKQSAAKAPKSGKPKPEDVLPSHTKLNLNHYPAHLLITLHAIADHIEETQQVIGYLETEVAKDFFPKNDSWFGKVTETCSRYSMLIVCVALPLFCVIGSIYLISHGVSNKLICINHPNDLLPC
ncbi:uncharacterized protein LOC134854231 isoform X2 [Symsagittifera roscoffensis]|uniref:uncharacterized protein LOC134854231 isoform X2 n=1 Tax=Symsagittifera roscoffensis TaxID=84072 RepID=UPI00307C5432